MSSEDLKNWGFVPAFWQSSRGETVSSVYPGTSACRRRTGRLSSGGTGTAQVMGGDLFGGTAGKRDAQEDPGCRQSGMYVRAMDRSCWIHIVLNSGCVRGTVVSQHRRAFQDAGGSECLRFTGIILVWSAVQREFFRGMWIVYELDLGEKSQKPMADNTCTGEEL